MTLEWQSTANKKPVLLKSTSREAEDDPDPTGRAPLIIQVDRYSRLSFGSLTGDVPTADLHPFSFKVGKFPWTISSPEALLIRQQTPNLGRPRNSYKLGLYWSLEEQYSLRCKMSSHSNTTLSCPDLVELYEELLSHPHHITFHLRSNPSLGHTRTSKIIKRTPQASSIEACTVLEQVHEGVSGSGNSRTTRGTRCGSDYSMRRRTSWGGSF
ncbi:hypothetical protein K402DRAFT_20366 [Aulographum hederae CBS 113979]|uniref:Uncharacterized protein n=1 Tax=Aulographum hederae CBS 113979 TaxID=1176131 RepID=A0A6G1H6F6_9PEZI|nr:hypothetical protein K402DRAFT_20366 [Aulographum hederae CBS 113979]